MDSPPQEVAVLLGIDSAHPGEARRTPWRTGGLQMPVGSSLLLSAGEAGCEREIMVSNCFTLASMCQDFPGKHFERFKLTLPITTCVHNLLLEEKNVHLTIM